MGRILYTYKQGQVVSVDGLVDTLSDVTGRMRQFVCGYGLLYPFNTVIDSRKISSSDDWIVPTGAWLSAFRTSEGNNSNPSKEIGTTYWDTANGTNVNALNFRGGGKKHQTGDGYFTGLKVDSQIHSSTPSIADQNLFLTIYDSGTYYYGQNSIAYGRSIRLVRLAGSHSLSEGEQGTYTGNDGRIYTTICYDGTEWIDEHLRETKFRNGDWIPEVIEDWNYHAMNSSCLCVYLNDWAYACMTRPVGLPRLITGSTSPSSNISGILSVQGAIEGTINASSDVVLYVGRIWAVSGGNLYIREGGSWSNKGDVFEGSIGAGHTRMSDDNKYALYACAIPHVSNDSLVSFDSTGLTSRNYSTAGINGTGQYMATVYSIGYLVKSSDYGVNWANDTEPGSANWRSVKISSSGQYWILVGYNTQIWLSDDYGDTWSSYGSTRTYYATFVSSSGQYQSAMVYGGTNYYSDDYGASFTAATGLPSYNWEEMDGSDSGQYQYAVASTSSKVYKSSDYGATWSALTNSITETYSWVNCNASGSDIVVADNASVWHSDDYGATWTEIDPGGVITAIGIARKGII